MFGLNLEDNSILTTPYQLSLRRLERQYHYIVYMHVIIYIAHSTNNLFTLHSQNETRKGIYTSIL